MLKFLVVFFCLASSLASLSAQALKLDVQRRDPVTGQPVQQPEVVDPKKVGIVVIDLWNWHWCKTATARVGALVPRMNTVLQEARKMGMTVFLCPTDVADNYVGTPQFERVLGYPRVALPEKQIDCPPVKDGGGCTCGPVRCQGNYGWDGMSPDLSIGEDDFIPNDPDWLYSICKSRGLTHLIYMGVHTQVCLLGKSTGVRSLLRTGLHCILARDLTDAHAKYDPIAGITPDNFTADVVEHFEKHLVGTIDFGETLKSNGLIKTTDGLNPVQFAPWGTLQRPHHFETNILVTLSQRWLKGAAIHYTLDGSEPSPQSPVYTQPLKVDRTTTVRAIALRDGKPASVPSLGHFVKQNTKPPMPDVFLGDLKAWRISGPSHSPSFWDIRFSPVSNPPQVDMTNRKQPLRLRGEKFAKGMGVHAPAQLAYEIKPEWERFVALAGVDEYILDVNSASNLGMHPSVIFRVFIDGKMMAESPMMRISEVPWRFDVPIPPGSKLISIVATDGGNGSKEDLANWVNAGFIVKKTQTSQK